MKLNFGQNVCQHTIPAWFIISSIYVSANHVNNVHTFVLASVIEIEAKQAVGVGRLSGKHAHDYPVRCRMNGVGHGSITAVVHCQRCTYEGIGQNE